MIGLLVALLFCARYNCPFQISTPRTFAIAVAPLDRSVIAVVPEPKLAMYPTPDVESCPPSQNPVASLPTTPRGSPAPAKLFRTVVVFTLPVAVTSPIVRSSAPVPVGIVFSIFVVDAPPAGKVPSVASSKPASSRSLPSVERLSKPSLDPLPNTSDWLPPGVWIVGRGICWTKTPLGVYSSRNTALPVSPNAAVAPLAPT